MDNIKELENQYKKLQEKLSNTGNENTKLNIMYDLAAIRKKIEKLNQNKPKETPKKVVVEQVKEEPKKEEKKTDFQNDDRGKVNAPNNMVAHPNKREEKKENDNNNKN